MTLIQHIPYRNTPPPTNLKAHPFIVATVIPLDQSLWVFDVDKGVLGPQWPHGLRTSMMCFEIVLDAWIYILCR